MLILGYLAAILMGVVLGLIGGGGSILTVPILVYLLQIDPTLATGYSLFIVGLTSLLGGLSYYMKGHVDLKVGFVFAVPSLIAVYLTRAFFIPSLPEELITLGSTVITKNFFIMGVFAILMLAASYSMIRKSPVKLAALEVSNKISFKKLPLIAIEGLVVGFITGLVGAGGGFLIIPALVILVGLPMKIAVGTSLLIIAVKSLIGFIGDVQSQASMDWGLLFTITILALIGITLGIRFSGKVPEALLKKSFGIFVLVMGSLILISEIIKI